MLRWLRHSSRVLGAVAPILATLVLLGTIDWWHVEDAEASSLPSLHDHDAHRAVLKTQPQADTEGGGHCYVCHWLRTFQNGLKISGHDALTDTEGSHLQPLSHADPCDRAGSLLPARAPPA